MPLSVPHNLQTNALSAGQMADVGAPAAVVNAPIPFRGRVVGAGCTISGALTGPDTIISVAKVAPGGPYPIGTITMPAAGSGAGSSYGMVITGNELACTVEAYQSLSFTTDGGATNSAVGNFVAIVQGS